MNIIKPKRVEDLIIQQLIRGELFTTDLLLKIRNIRKNTTKQGFYAALRKLKHEEIVLIYKGTVSLNTIWIKKMRETFEDISKTYTTNQKSFDVLGLEDKESISYSFSNIKSLDIFWGHSQNILIHNTSHLQPIYSYDPHYWFYLARRESEKELLSEIVKHKRQFLMSVGGTSHLDKVIKNDFNSDYLQYNYKRIFNKENYYVTIIGEYITEVFLDEEISKKIDSLYNNSTNDEKSITILKSFLEAKAKNRIKISRNALKSRKLKAKMGKEFYIIRT